MFNPRWPVYSEVTLLGAYLESANRAMMTHAAASDNFIVNRQG